MIDAYSLGERPVQFEVAQNWRTNQIQEIFLLLGTIMNTIFILVFKPNKEFKNANLLESQAPCPRNNASTAKRLHQIRTELMPEN